MRSSGPTKQAVRIRKAVQAACAGLALTALSPGRAPAQLPDQASGAAGAGAGIGAVDVDAVPRPVARAHRTSGPIRVDGVLDEAAWLDADSIGGFVQSQPHAGRPATEATLVHFLYDDRALYIGAVLFDSDPGEMVVSTLERDFPGESTRDYDIFGIALDAFHDRKDSFLFLINPRGALRDGQTFDDSRAANFAWDGISQVETRIHERGWTLEMAIPWTSLRFDQAREEQVFGLNLLRRVRRKNEDSYWAPLDRRDPVHRMSRAGTLVGVRALPRTRNLALTPYVVAGSALGRGPAGEHPARPSLDAGMDLKYGVTPKLTLDLTYRTDFSQVEVDEEQVNLTRFSLFFPEKRDFFVENSGVFTFGDVSEREYRMGASLRDFTLFHSRRIGLREGRPVPIVGGGRLTGRAGGFELGLLDMQTEASADGPGENFAVARLRRGFGPVQIGGIAINRQSTDGSAIHSRSWGVDAHGRLLGNLILNSYVAGTHPSGSAPGLAGRVAAGWRDRLWNVSAMHKRVDADFDPGVGFIRRRGMAHTYATVGLHPRPDIPLVQEVNPYVEGDYITNPRDRLDTRTGTAGLAVTFLDGGRLDLDVTDRFERLDEPFPVGPAVVPPASYHYREGSLRYQSSAGRPLAARLSISGGEFFGGDRRSLGVGAAWRASYRLSLELSADRNDVRLPGHSFAADLYGARVRYSHSRSLSGSAYVQYNDALDQVVSNLRLNMIHAPLSDLFLVYTDRRSVGGAEQGAAERFLTMKVTRMVAF